MCYPEIKKHRNDLTLEQFEQLFQSKVLTNLVFLLITGGEPFLRKDLREICFLAVKTIPGLKQLRLASNGLLTEKIIEQVEMICREAGIPLSLKISIDGVGERHDRLRGIDGAFEKAMNTLQGLEELRTKKSLDLSLSVSFTVLDENVDQIKDVYSLIEGRDIDFFFKPGHDFCHETNRKGGGSNLTISENTRKKMIEFMHFFFENDFGNKHSFANSGRKIFYHEMYNFLQNPEKLHVSCSAGFSSFLILSGGEVYACSSHSAGRMALGNLTDNTLDEIWFSKKARKIRNMIKQGKCSCYTGCDLAPSIITCCWDRVISDYLHGGSNKQLVGEKYG